MSEPRRELSFVPVPLAGASADADQRVALEKYRSLGGESHRVLRCLETILATDRYEIVDTGQIARFLGIKSQAVSRALRTLVELSIIERGSRIGRSNTFRRIDPAPATSVIEDRLLRLDAAARETVKLIEAFLARNGAGFDDLAVRKYLKFGMVLYYLHGGSVAGTALIDYNPIIDSGPTVVHLVVDQALRAHGHGRKFLAHIERYFAGKRIFAHAPTGEKDLIIALLRHGFDIVGQETTDGNIALILKKGPGA